MHKDFYHQTQKENLVEINFSKFLTIIIVIMIFFVLPIQLIDLSKKQTTTQENTTEITASSNSEQEGRVAGASTSINDYSGSGVNIDFTEKSTQFILLGVFFLGVSLSTLAYLLRLEKIYHSSSNLTAP